MIQSRLCIYTFANVSMTRTHYDILGVKEDATCDEIRTSYRSSILNYHPDKLQKTPYNDISNSNNQPQDRFLEIQKAWEILGNSKSRAVYDIELQALRQDAITSEDVSLEDLTVEDAGDALELYYQCRCGDCFTIDSLELEQMGYLLLRDGNKEPPSTGSKRCKFLTSTLKDAFANCHTFRGRLSCSSQGEEYNPAHDDEQEVFVSAVLSRYMEAKAKHKGSLTLESFCWAIDLPLGINQNEESSGGVEEGDDYFSVGSCFSRCLSATNTETFLSVKTNLSRCSSLSHVEFLDWQSQRSIIEEFCHCEGWPFGLCRKALLLPPLPKSPSESWSWRKRTSARMVK